MASYVDNTLIPNEVIIYTAHVSLWSLFFYLLPGALILVVGLATVILYWQMLNQSTAELSILLLVLVVGLLALLWAYVQYTSTEFAVTDKRIIAKTGFISRKTVEMFLGKVESLNVDQSVMGRILNYGTVGIRGTGITEEAIRNISSPLELRKQFMTAADAYKTKG